MKAAVLEKDGIRVTSVEEPIVEPGMIKVRVAYCGICGSDIPRVLQGRVHFFPIILGHEFSGTVAEIGDGVRSFSIGDKVVGVPLMPCFQCDNCKKGNYSLCSNYKFIGSSVNGAYAEFVCVSEKNLLKLPNEFDLKDAALIEPCTIARHAFDLVPVKGKRTQVVGSGVIGLFAVQWARTIGASQVTLITHGKKNYDSEKIGADSILQSEDVSTQFDVIIDCAGTKESLITSISISSPKANIILIGTPTADMLFTSREWEQINRKEILIVGSWMSYSDDFPGIQWRDSITKLNDKSLRVIGDMVSCTQPLDNIAELFSNIMELKKNGRVLLKIHS